MTVPASKYRADIDGLRAVAVLAVILFHINKTWLPGGFIGVDVFFVISGYLITGNIVRDIGKRRFSIIEFYRRRVKRIAPAMLLVVAVSLCVANVLMLPNDAATMAKSAVWSLASLANVYFWIFQDSSYFAASSEHQPLLHLWSLGVEEQFYLIWPAVLVLAYRPGREKRVIAVGLVVAALSFALGSLYFARDPLFVYYMLPTRAGELLTGALVALALARGAERRVSAFMGAPLGLLGALLLGTSLAWLSEDAIFPGIRAVPPSLGAALIIVAGDLRSNWVSRALRWRPLVGVGLVSYSAYLWHWPLLSFYRYGYGEVSWRAGAVIFAATLLLAWLTYRFVEQPARKSHSTAVQVFARQFVLPGCAVFALSLWAIYGDRLWSGRLESAYRHQLAGLHDQTRPALAFDYVCLRQKASLADATNARCVVGTGAAQAQKILLWGDSNAAHYVGMLGAFASKAGFRFRNVEVGSCPPILGDPTPFVEARRAKDCRESIPVVRPLLESARVVIISAAWTDYQDKSDRFLDAFFDTVRGIAASGKRVILVGKAPVIKSFDRLCLEKALTFPFLTCSHIRQAMPLDVEKANSRLRQFAQTTANVRYFDATSYLCPHGECAPYGRDGAALYYDQSHLAMSGSWKLGHDILSAEGVPEVFRSLSIQ